jgi:hypothetical protein
LANDRQTPSPNGWLAEMMYGGRCKEERRAGSWRTVRAGRPSPSPVATLQRLKWFPIVVSSTDTNRIKP